MIARQAARQAAQAVRKPRVSSGAHPEYVGPDDERPAQVVRLLRRRQGLSQRDLSRLAGVPRVDVIDIEAGRAGDIAVSRIRRAAEALGGRARLNVWYNGAAADRLFYERHAAIGEHALAFIVAVGGWTPLSEVTFARYGERGSLDLLAAHPSSGAVLIGEVKSAIGSLEALNRTFDAKYRLAAKIAEQTLWLVSGQCFKGAHRA